MQQLDPVTDVLDPRGEARRELRAVVDRGDSGSQRGSGSESKGPFIAAAQTTSEERPLYACFGRQPFNVEAAAESAARSLATSASSQVVSDGPRCFRGVTIVGADHGSTVAGGGKASAKLP